MFRHTAYAIMCTTFADRCRWSGAAVMGICLLFFAITSLVDPGIVTDQNQAFHQALYAYDEVTSTQKDCTTCHLSRPARSKHCPICTRCTIVTYYKLAIRLSIKENSLWAVLLQKFHAAMAVACCLPSPAVQVYCTI